MARTYKWGILGPGKIAHRFADAIRNVSGSNVYGVASRDVTRAEEFAATYHMPVVHENYEALIKGSFCRYHLYSHPPFFSP